jgi:serine/threonine protein phosphatase PrpC
MSGWTKQRLPLKFAEAFQVQGLNPVQEDYFEINVERGIFILADGFGGTAGRQAAEVAVKSARKFMEQEAGDLDATLPFELRPYYSLAGNVLLNAVAFANQKVLQLNDGRMWERSGGTSLIAGYLEGKLLSVAQVGACRMHLKREKNLKQVVSPKTLLSQTNPFLEEGDGDSIPLMSLGTAKRLEPEIIEVELRPEDQVFIESTGVGKRLREAVGRIAGPSVLSQLVDEARPGLRSNASLLWLGF